MACHGLYCIGSFYNIVGENFLTKEEMFKN